MSVIALPAKFVPRSCTLTLSTNQLAHASPYGGSEQVIDLLNDRWMMSCEVAQASRATGAWREAFIASMRGKTNTVALYHFARKAPAGTLRGTLTLSGTPAQGAASVVLAGGSPAAGTLLAGDMIGVGGLLLMVASDCAASGGVITVPITNRLRKSIPSGTAVTWDKPTAMFRLMNTEGIGYVPGLSNGASFDFAEAIA